MSNPHRTSHKRNDSALVNSYNGLPKLLPKTAALPRTTPRSDLLQLPPDIRNIIYELVFYEPEGILIDFSHDNYHAGSRSVAWLASTCKQIYDECHNLPYWINTFHFRVPVFQDLQAVRAISPSMLKFPLPARDPSPRRHIRSTPPQVVPKWTEPKALQFVTMAMRDPHIDEIMQRFDQVVGQWRITTKLRIVHVDLGSITNNTFLDRFYHAWDEIAPRLAALSGSTSVGSEVRLIFQLRLSRRFVVDYDFTLKEKMAAMREMDLCVSRGACNIEEFTLPELGTINAIRTRVWKTFFLTGLPDESPLPPHLSRTFPSLEECKQQHSMRPRACGEMWPLSIAL